ATAASAWPDVTRPGVVVRIVGLRTAPVASVKSWLGDSRDRVTCSDAFAIVSGLAFVESGATGEMKPDTTPTMSVKKTLNTSQTASATIADVAARLTTTEHSSANASQKPMYISASTHQVTRRRTSSADGKMPS